MSNRPLKKATFGITSIFVAFMKDEWEVTLICDRALLPLFLGLESRGLYRDVSSLISSKIQLKCNCPKWFVYMGKSYPQNNDTL